MQLQLKTVTDLLAENAIENFAHQKNVQEDSQLWVVPTQVKMVNLTMKKPIGVKMKLLSAENVVNATNPIESNKKIECKVCDKQILLSNFGRHTQKVHCLLLKEYEDVYGDIKKQLMSKSKVWRRNQISSLKTEKQKEKSSRINPGIIIQKKEQFAVEGKAKSKTFNTEDYQKLTTKQLLEELERVLAA